MLCSTTHEKLHGSKEENTYESQQTSNKPGNVCAGAALVTLLAVQIIVGYEWLASGITKIASGTFVSGMAADLKDKSAGAAHWYRSFLNGTIIPNAHAFAVLIEIGEIIVGVGFMAAAIVWLTRWSRLSDRWRTTILTTVMLSALGATFMAINFHLANGGNHPWLIPADGFDETIDVDTVLAFIQGAFFFFSGYLLLNIRRQHQASAIRTEAHHGAVPAAS
jgi:thiosulfate dehydrogenase (quinone) large subunit